MKSKVKIVVQGTKLISSYLKKNLKIPSSIFYSKVQDDEYDTVGGFVINAFGYLPKRGETTDFDRFNIKVLRADKRRVNLLLFTINEPENVMENESNKEWF